MPKEDYEKAISGFIEQLTDKVSTCESRDKLINKISGAYQMGSNERFFTFLEELGLNYGKDEKESIRARNNFTHGGSNVSYEEVLKNTRTMYLLLARVILKLLGYDGQYIDTSVNGYPRKYIDEKIG